MNPDLDRLHPYPFEKLAKLKAGMSVPEGLRPISLGIGEPKHPSPEFVKQVIADNLDKLANYHARHGRTAPGHRGMGHPSFQTDPRLSVCGQKCRAGERDAGRHFFAGPVGD